MALNLPPPHTLGSRGAGDLQLELQKLPGAARYRRAGRAVVRWNTFQSGYAGFVTKFEIDDVTAKRYPIQLAGGRSHEELWVPADELPEFNAHIVGIISVMEAFTGERFAGALNPTTLIPVEFDATHT